MDPQQRDNGVNGFDRFKGGRGSQRHLAAEFLGLRHGLTVSSQTGNGEQLPAITGGARKLFAIGGVEHDNATAVVIDHDIAIVAIHLQP